MKKLMLILMLLTALFCWADLSDSQITVSSGTVNSGETIELNVTTTELLEEWDVISFQFEINYDPQAVTFTDYTYGDMLSTGGLLIMNELEPGYVRAAFSHYMAQEGAGIIANIMFEGIAGESVIDLHDFRYNTTSIFNITDGQITVNGGNQFPVADAGEDISVQVNEIVTLDGTGSYDPEGADITFNWVAPAGITLDDNTAAQPTFTAPVVTEDTEFVITLTVDDGDHESLPDEVIVTVLEPSANNEVPGFVSHVEIENISPNPFNPETRISFLVPAEETDLNLVIYSIRGQKVREYNFSGLQGNSREQVIWDGQDYTGKDAASGIYFCRVTGEKTSASARMLLLK